MAIRDTLARLFGAKASIVGLAADQIPDRPLEKSYDDATLLSTYGDDAWPYIVANKVGEQASQAPVQVGTVKRTREGHEEFTPSGPDHPVQALFDHPTPNMDGGEFVHLLLLYMGFAGHAPIEFVKPAPGLIIGAPGRRGTRQRAGFELWLHNPGPWRIVANPNATIAGYLYLIASGSDISWTPDEMTYLRWPNPANRWYGQGHVQAIRQQVMAEEYAAIRDRKFEKNLGVPPGILSFEGPLGDPQAAELQKRWQQSVGGYQNAGRIAILGSKGTYIPISQNARDSEWLAQRLNRVEIICGAWGMPLPLIRMQDATFNNVSEARSELWEGTLQPRLNRIARMLTWKVIPLVTSEPLAVRFDYTKIEALGENDKEAAETAKAWSDTGSVTVDEVRQRLGLDAHPDKAFGERLIVPTTITYKDPAEIAEAAAMGLDGQRAGIEATRNPPQERVPPKAAKAESADRDIVLGPIRDAYRADLLRYFTRQHAAIGDAFKFSTDEIGRIIERAIAIITAKRFRDLLRRISERPISEAIAFGAADAAAKLAIDVSFAIPASQAALARVTNHLDLLGKGVENTTVADVQRVLTGSLREGVGNAETRKRLDVLFGDYRDWRLDRISRTETTAAYNLGAIGQYRDAGVQLVKVSDGDKDEPCAQANGALWTLEEAEANPISHPNCTRTWIPDTSRL